VKRPFSRRERQIVDVLYERGEASAEEVLAALPDPPSYSAVRATLRILEEKGHVRHIERGLRYVYQPVVPAQSARRGAVEHVLRTFFRGNAEEAVAALLDASAASLSEEELDRLGQLIERAKKERPVK
jgi:BlaI family transcriptional regulator, penicillinase repressor